MSYGELKMFIEKYARILTGEDPLPEDMSMAYAQSRYDYFVDALYEMFGEEW